MSIALKRIYVDGFDYSPSQDLQTTIPLPVDVVGTSSQMPSGYPTTDFAWWDTSIKPSLNRSGSTAFRGNILIPTFTDTVITTRVEHTSSNSYLKNAPEIFHSFSFYSPINTPIDPRYVVVQQWHGGVGGSPPISIRVQDGRIFFLIHTGSTFLNQQRLDVGPVVNGSWHHFVIYIKWQNNLDGILTVWRDGKIARTHGPDGQPWVPPVGETPGISRDYVIKPDLGTLPNVITENGSDVALCDWRGKTNSVHPNPEKFFKCGIYKSSWNSFYNPDGTLKDGVLDDPDSEMYVPEELRIIEHNIGNVNFETRFDEIPHEEIFKSLDINGNSPEETPDWWVESVPVTITSPQNNSSFQDGSPITIETDVEDGVVELLVDGNIIDIKNSPPYSFSVFDIPRNNAVLDLPFDSNTNNWGSVDSDILINNSSDVVYVEGVREQAISLGNDSNHANKSWIKIPNTGLLSNISNSFTVSFWIKADFGSGLSSYILSSYDNSGGSGIRISSVTNGTLEILLYTEGNDPVTLRISTGSILDPNEFNHYIATYDGQFIKWYYNLEFINQLNVGELDVSASNDWHINAAPNEAGRQNIILDDFRIYDYAVLEDDINDLVVDKYIGSYEVKARRFGVESDPVTINIVEELPTFTITATATTGGQVSGDGEYEENEEVTLTATPDSGHEFVGWEEDSETVSTDNPYIFNAEGDRVLLAVFIADEVQPKHQIALTKQKFILPGNASSGDQLGEVSYLYTFCKFWNDREGTSLSESDFRFSKVSGPSNFTVDNLTGMIAVSSMTGVDSDTSIVVKVAIGGMDIDVTCEISYIPTADCVFIDPSASSDGSGTKASPYKKFRTGANNTGVPGKAYLLKRGTTIENDWITIVNSPTDKTITIAAYGSGPRPLVNGSNNIEGAVNNRFIKLGENMAVDGSEPEKAANNVRVFDLETTLDNPNDNAWYPFEVKVIGNNIQFSRIKCSHVGLWEEGFFWLTGTTDTPVVNRNIVLSNIETYENKHRAIKVETSGVKVLNYRGYSDVADCEFPISFANKPVGRMKYLDIELGDHGSEEFGVQIRAYDQNYEWVYIDGAHNPLTVYSIVNDYEINANNFFKNVILKNCKTRLSFFGKATGVTVDADGVVFQNIKAIDSDGNLEISQGAKNTKVVYSDLSGNGIRFWASAGSGLDIENVKVKNIVLDTGSAGVEVVNTQYESITGPHTSTTSTTSTDAEDLVGQGTDLGYEYDILGDEVGSPPTIGPYENLVIEEKYLLSIASSDGGSASGGGSYKSGDVVQLTATTEQDYKFVGWYRDGSYLTDANPYNYTTRSQPDTVEARFELIPIPEYTITVIPSMGGSVSGGGTYEEGQSVTLSAMPQSGWTFVKWSNDATDNPYSFTASENLTISAIFEEVNPEVPYITVKGKFKIV